MAKSDLVIIAARPGMGKTAFILSMARNIAIDHKKEVAIFTRNVIYTTYNQINFCRN